MIKKDFCKKINKELKLKGIKTDFGTSTKIVDTFFDVLSENIVKGKSVSISNFGTFSSELRTVRNLAENKSEDRWIIVFKPSKKMKKDINDN